MSDFTAHYEQQGDRLVITRVDAAPAGRVDDFVSQRGVRVQTDVKQRELFRVEIPQFSRHIDFLDLYWMFGEEFVRSLVELQGALTDKQWTISVSRSPLRSRDLLLELTPA